jgi:hypothetical protein
MSDQAESEQRVPLSPVSTMDRTTKLYSLSLGRESLISGMVSAMAHFAISSLIDSSETKIISSSKIRESTDDEFKKNVAAYKQMEDELIRNPDYMGAFIALYKQRIVAKGHDKVRLLQDVYSKYGYVPVLVHRVGDRRVVHYRSPRRSV